MHAARITVRLAEEARRCELFYREPISHIGAGFVGDEGVFVSGTDWYRYRRSVSCCRFYLDGNATTIMQLASRPL